MTQGVTIGSQGLAEELHRSKSLFDRSLLSAMTDRQPWNVDPKRPILCLHGLAGLAVAVVADLTGFLGARRAT